MLNVSPKALTYTTAVVLCLALVLAISLAWANSASRNIALAVGTLSAAILLLFVQLYFEMQPSETKIAFASDYTIDHGKLGIRHWDYTHASNSWRMVDEVAASDWLVKDNPKAFDIDSSRLVSDLTLVSLLSYLGHEQYDWQVDKFTAPTTMGTLTFWNRVSTPAQCTQLPSTEIGEKLKAAGNLFHGTPIGIAGGGLCLPPSTILTISGDTLEIANSFCRIFFVVRTLGGISYMKPGSGGDVPTLSDGRAQYESRATQIIANVEYSGFRAQHRLASKYRDWAARVTEGARNWFETTGAYMR